jgi:hypothetical protein
MTNTEQQPVATGERADLIEALDRHRYFLRFAVRGLTDEQAMQRSTVSQLCLAALIKHVAATEATWVRFIQGGADAMGSDPEAWARDWRIEPGETLEGLLAAYDAVARDTDALVAALPVVRTRRRLVGPTGAATHSRRDRPACGPRGHSPRGDRRPEDDGLS